MVLSEGGEHLLRAQRIDHEGRLQAPLAGDVDTELDILQTVGRVRVRVDADSDPPGLGVTAQPPIEIQSVGIGIDLEAESFKSQPYEPRNLQAIPMREDGSVGYSV